MKIVYVLNGAELYGGVKVVLQHALALRRLGVEATVVSPDPAPSWFRTAESVYRRVDDLEASALPSGDVFVGSIWFTVPVAAAAARESPGAIAAHLCQAYEGWYEPLRARWPEIDRVYRLPTAKLAVSPHLVRLLEDRFRQPCHWIPQPLDHSRFFPPRDEDGGSRAAPDASRPLRVLVSGQWELEVKGTRAAMEALRPLTLENPPLELVRLSQDAPDDELAFWPDAERHVGVPPEAVPDLLRSVDLYAAASTREEGFGLPTLEAMACGRPTVLTAIGANRALDPEQSASIQVPPGDAPALRAAVRSLRDDAERRRALGRAGIRLAADFSEERTGRTLRDHFERLLADATSTTGAP